MTSWQKLIGSLLWIARCTRPGIMFAVHAATRRTHAPSENDLESALKILKYLKGSKDLKLKFDKWESANGMVIVSGYADADWADNKSTRKSVSGGIVSINGMPVQWICKKQSSVSLSSLLLELKWRENS